MDSVKFGAFLKELRMERGITQEQMAAQYGVSNRTVSRWETGNNLPDLDLLLQISDDYGVTIRELLDGKRQAESGDSAWQKTTEDILDISNKFKRRMTKMMRCFFIAGALMIIAYLVMWAIELPETRFWGFVQGFTQGASFGVMLLGILYTSGILNRLSKVKKRFCNM